MKNNRKIVIASTLVCIAILLIIGVLFATSNKGKSDEILTQNNEEMLEDSSKDSERNMPEQNNEEILNEDDDKIQFKPLLKCLDNVWGKNWMEWTVEDYIEKYELDQYEVNTPEYILCSNELNQYGMVDVSYGNRWAHKSSWEGITYESSLACAVYNGTNQAHDIDSLEYIKSDFGGNNFDNSLPNETWLYRKILAGDDYIVEDDEVMNFCNERKFIDLDDVLAYMHLTWDDLDQNGKATVIDTDLGKATVSYVEMQGVSKEIDIMFSQGAELTSICVDECVQNNEQHIYIGKSIWEEANNSNLDDNDIKMGAQNDYANDVLNQDPNSSYVFIDGQWIAVPIGATEDEMADFGIDYSKLAGKSVTPHDIDNSEVVATLEISAPNKSTLKLFLNSGLYVKDYEYKKGEIDLTNELMTCDSMQIDANLYSIMCNNLIDERVYGSMGNTTGFNPNPYAKAIVPWINNLVGSVAYPESQFTLKVNVEVYDGKTLDEEYISVDSNPKHGIICAVTDLVKYMTGSNNANFVLGGGNCNMTVVINGTPIQLRFDTEIKVE